MYVFNVQHLYFACLDEGKIKEHGTMLIRNLFLFARNTFFSVKNLKLEEPTPQ